MKVSSRTFDPVYPKPFLGMPILNIDYNRLCVVTQILDNPDIARAMDLSSYGAAKYHLRYYQNLSNWRVPSMQFTPTKEHGNTYQSTLQQLSREGHEAAWIYNTVKIKDFQHLRFANGFWTCDDSIAGRDCIESFEKGCLPVPSEIVSEVLGEQDQVTDLKTLNTDGRLLCARCNGPIKIVLGMSSIYNHCPKCEG